MGDRPAQHERRGQYRCSPFTGVGHRAAGVGSILADPFDRGIGEYPRLPPRIGDQAASFSRALALIIAAPFSAIMIVGALVFVELTAGITEVSTTRSASLESVDSELAVDDRHAVIAHHARAARVVDG